MEGCFDGRFIQALSSRIPSKLSSRPGISSAQTSNSVDVAEIDEPCDHSVQFGGMCANCGKDMTEYACFSKRAILCM